jgi:cellulose synthase/poly-beta-1,6-N-acetylglucosamine synthase-like glycosyltransferase
LQQVNASIGICVYNEGKNIGKLLEMLLSQKTNIVRISDIYVISSGSTDNTNSIVKNYAKIDPRVKLITQENREGKASAINLFLGNASSEVLVLQSGDTLPEEDTIEKLVEPFVDPSIGMTGGHSMPVNDRKTFLGFTVQLQWELLHQLSLVNPRFGELIAFRNILKSIPKDTAMDEAYIEFAMEKHGLKLKYSENARLYNRGPEDIGEFLNQRRRNYAGHLALKKNTGYAVSSLGIGKVIFLTRNLDLTAKELLFAFGSMTLEILARVLGTYDFYIKKRNPYKWDILKTTKELNE